MTGYMFFNAEYRLSVSESARPGVDRRLLEGHGFSGRYGGSCNRTKCLMPCLVNGT